MSLKVYNTLHGKKEDFVPLNANKVSMYVCGVTVYDYCHVGHARSAIVFDVIRKYLRHKGYDVLFVKNFTDIDDKIINRAQEEGISTRAVAEKYIRAHHEDFNALGVEPADIEPKATQHIADMLPIVEGLVKKGLAYEVDGDVYFSVKKFPGYGKLSGRNIDDLQSGARVDIDTRKHDPLDFALWKASKPGEPAWESPWGQGRPGWHLECSAMSEKYLGQTFDIHGGGKDLIFPHHENEIAQSEGYFGTPLARYWLHNGFLKINQEKMSKSLGNFFTIREVLQKFNPEALRFLMLSTHYRSPLDYSEDRLEEAAAALKRFHNTFHDVERLQKLVNTDSPAGQLSAEAVQHLSDLPGRMTALQHSFEEAMDDDFNTAAAIGTLFDMLKAINSTVRTITGLPSLHSEHVQPLNDALATIKTLSAVLGLTFIEQSDASETDRLIAQLVSLLLELRHDARKAKNWQMADRIRDALCQIGIQVKDHPGGASSWELNQ